MKSNDPPSYGEKTFPDNVCVCARVYMCVCGVWGFGGGHLKWGGKSYGADSSLVVGVVLTTITNHLCLPRTFVRAKTI